MTYGVAVEQVKRGTSDPVLGAIARLRARPSCSCCGRPNDRLPQRYCKTCHAAKMREWRSTHPLNEEQRRKDNARSYAGVYLRRGLLPRQPCEDCGSPDSQMHHADYTRPLDVTWLCRRCHLDRHKEVACKRD